jgi:hypothetical protein
MGDENILDIAHLSFLDMIKIMIPDGRNTKGTHQKRHGQRTRWWGGLSGLDDICCHRKCLNPITMIEGKATHAGDYVFGLQNCPFGPSIKNYTQVFEKLPEGFADFTAEFNKQSKPISIVLAKGRRKPFLLGTPADESAFAERS